MSLNTNSFVLSRQRYFIFCTMIANKEKGQIYIKSDLLASYGNSYFLDGEYSYLVEDPGFRNVKKSI